MDTLFKLFPEQNFLLLAVILGLPLTGAFVNGVFGRRLGKEAVKLMALMVVFASFVASVTAFAMLWTKQAALAAAAGGHGAGQGAGHGAHEAAAHAAGAAHHVVAEAARFKWVAWHWMDLSGRGDMASVPIEVAFSVDALSGTMALVVTGVGFLIHLYSSRYMADDPGYYRFFAYLNLFIFSMLVLILGDSLPVLFIGWEGVGLCSYLLIGFWFHEMPNAAAGKKAFIANRVGDFGLLVAMGLLVYYVGRLDWSGIEAGKGALIGAHKIWPVGSGFYGIETVKGIPLVGAFLAGPHWVLPASLVALALFLGATGKSAQIPLYVWLPDAMAGPTPVSALIHAATMVTAGIYLICRLSFIFVMSPFAMFTVALIGALTALLAASIALVQNDIKKVLAYSTVSQLGYMFLGVGVGAFTAGFFHVLTHAFFKACLFLGAGSVIHAMHARIHDTEQSQDMRNMGGMAKFMPLTHITFLVSCLAIAGMPLTSGFFSKDEILFRSFVNHVNASPAIAEGGRVLANPPPDAPLWVTPWSWPAWGGYVLYGIGAITAVMTAFYMFRLYFLTFHGDFKGWKIVKGWKDPHAGHHDDDHGHDDHHHEEPGVDNMDGPTPHESPWEMTTPLVVLGVLAAFGGFLSAHALGVVGLSVHPLDTWLEPVFNTAMGGVHHPHGEAMTAAEKTAEYVLIGAGVLIFAVGVGAAYVIYMVQKGEPTQKLADSVPWLHQLLLDKWRVDELYEETIIGAVDTLAELSVWVDKWIVDGIIARFSAFLVAASGTLLRYTQTGRVQAYAAFIMVGLVGLGWFFTAPHAAAQTFGNPVAGTFRLEAAPGLGYLYRWDTGGKGNFEEDFTTKDSVEVRLADKEEKRVVRLQVKNAFGQVATKVVELKREKKDERAPGSSARLRRPKPGEVRRLRARQKNNPHAPTPGGKAHP